MKCRECDGQGAYWTEPHPLDWRTRGAWQRCHGCDGTGIELFDCRFCGKAYAGYQGKDGHSYCGDVGEWEQLERDGLLED